MPVTGDMNKGFRGIACLAEHKAEFAESIETAVRYANTLGCKKLMNKTLSKDQPYLILAIVP